MHEDVSIPSMSHVYMLVQVVLYSWSLAALQSDVSEIKGGLTKLTDMVQGLVDRTL